MLRLHAGRGALSHGQKYHDLARQLQGSCSRVGGQLARLQPHREPVEGSEEGGQQLGLRQQSRRARRQDQEGVEEPGQEQDLPHQPDQLHAESDRGLHCRQGRRDQVLGLVVCVVINQMSNYSQ